MNDAEPSFFHRFFLAFSAFGRTLASGEFAAGVHRLRRGGAVTVPATIVAVPAEPPKSAPLSEVLKTASPDAALQLLGLLQQEGRLIDFLQEDVAGYSDAEIGAAARVVHEGCRKTLRAHLALEPVRAEAEGSRLTVAAGFDAQALRLIGNVVGQPPFAGTLVHRGWRVAEVRLPKLAEGHDARVIQPAEVEL